MLNKVFKLRTLWIWLPLFCACKLLVGPETGIHPWCYSKWFFYIFISPLWLRSGCPVAQMPISLSTIVTVAHHVTLPAETYSRPVPVPSGPPTVLSCFRERNTFLLPFPREQYSRPSLAFSWNACSGSYYFCQQVAVLLHSSTGLCRCFFNTAEPACMFTQDWSWCYPHSPLCVNMFAWVLCRWQKASSSLWERVLSPAEGQARGLHIKPNLNSNVTRVCFHFKAPRTQLMSL